MYQRCLSFDRAMVAQFGDPLRPLEPDCKVIQFAEPLSPTQLRLAGQLVVDRPDVELYVYGKASRDLDFLKYFDTARRLHLALFELENIDDLSHLRGGLESLTFGDTKRKFSLRFLETMPGLKKLFLVGHKTDLPSLQALAELEDLGLSGITLPDLSLLLPLVRLRKLALLLGGTTNLAELPRLSRLEDLFLMRITKLSDLDMLGDIASLKTLRLDWMRNVMSLPSLAGLTRLEDVTLDTMKGLTDLAPIAAAQALRRLVVTSMPQLTAENFHCFIGHPRLAELWAGTGRSRVNERIKQMLPLIAR
jgi:Leucine-rich repeat (LRR) protein